MQRIQVLDEQIANLIAAGEVIERPASVVKELLENALDAGSTQVEIRVEQGGLQRVMIRDNGIGIHPDDCALAFQRHATSKIRSSRDLFRIMSLGFRGEALPSIASVAKVECTSCTDDSAQASRVIIHGGRPISQETVAAPKGTTLDVRELFYNTPARLKYMKTIQTEFGQIADVVQRLALARADVAFSLYHDEHLILRTTGRNDVREVISAIYGRDVAKELIPVQFQNADLQMSGYISKPSVSRSNRHAITWLVNGRYIRSTLLNQAMMDGFHTLLPLHRYPVAVLRITMDAQLLDVNVHPAKWEVRFSKEQGIRESVQEAIRQALGKEVHIPDADVRQTQPMQWSSPPKSSEVLLENTYPAPPTTGTSTQPFRETATPERKDWQQAAVGTTYEPMQLKMEQWGQLLSGPDETVPTTKSTNMEQPPKLPGLQPVGQAHGTYILAQDEDAIYLIDQHAAHERIHYEKFYRMFSQASPVVQPLLVPLPFEMPADEYAWFIGLLPQLEAVGIVIEPFGPNSFVVRAHPEWFPPERAGELAREVIDWMIQQKKSFHLSRLRDYAAKMCACKASIRANDRITLAEMQSLIHQLQACEQPYTCPHGRPVIVRFTSYDLEKLFKRVM